MSITILSIHIICNTNLLMILLMDQGTDELVPLNTQKDFTFLQDIIFIFEQKHNNV